MDREKGGRDGRVERGEGWMVERGEGGMERKIKMCNFPSGNFLKVRLGLGVASCYGGERALWLEWIRGA